MLNKNDSVSVAFDLMLHELEIEVDELNERGASHFKRSDYNNAQLLSRAGQDLSDFRNRVIELQSEWASRFSSLFEGREPAQEVHHVARTITSASKSPKTWLRIILPDGTLLEEKPAALCFARAIQALGVEKVMKLNLRVNGEPLISTTRSEKYNDTELERYFFRTHSSTKHKRDLLEDITRKLGVRLKVEVVG